MCADCRDHFVRFPIPHWVRAFAGAVVILVLFSLYTFPKNISAAISLEKGKKAEKEKKYVTAQREMEDVLEKIPRNVEARGHLIIDAFYNRDYDAMGEQYEYVRYSGFDDHELVGQIDYVMSKSSLFFVDSTDSFPKFRKAHPDLQLLPDTSWKNYMGRNPHDILALSFYGNILYESGRYELCDSCMRQILLLDRENGGAFGMLSAVKRKQHKLDSALYYNERLLAINKELPDGLESKARTLLLLRRDKEALSLAREGYELGNKDLYSQTTLILAYHFNGLATDRDDLIKKATIAAATADSSDREIFRYAIDVVTNKEKFRD
ncbi:tetratricopeptide repeat protein [Puia sp. P3]|uniref:tetratricopeptide repeat protein n=1 Tax=Puia sp. P3 TaxID=3423952 RepID=UPI003D667DD0